MHFILSGILGLSILSLTPTSTSTDVRIVVVGSNHRVYLQGTPEFKLMEERRLAYFVKNIEFEDDTMFSRCLSHTQSLLDEKLSEKGFKVVGLEMAFDSRQDFMRLYFKIRNEQGMESAKKTLYLQAYGTPREPFLTFTRSWRLGNVYINHLLKGVNALIEADSHIAPAPARAANNFTAISEEEGSRLLELAGEHFDLLKYSEYDYVDIFEIRFSEESMQIELVVRTQDESIRFQLNREYKGFSQLSDLVEMTDEQREVLTTKFIEILREALPDEMYLGR